MKCAIYRLFYGEDFIKESIESIYDYVDKIFVCWTDKAFKGVVGAKYKGKFITFPTPIDNAVNIVREMAKTHYKIELIYDFWPDIDDQFRHQVRDLIIPNFGMPNFAMAVESDMVFSKEMLEGALSDFEEEYTKDKEVAFASMQQIFLWRRPDYQVVPTRRYSGVIFWNFDNMPYIPKCGKAAAPAANVKPPFKSVYLKQRNHNFGYLVSERNMYWDHLVHLGFSGGGVDSMPNENWYEEKWLKWDPVMNNKNLHPSRGYEHFYPEAIPYDVTALPDNIKRKFEI